MIMLASNQVYRLVFLEKDIQEHSPIINQVRKLVSDSALIIYFGESSDNTSRGDDLDKRAISSFVADHYPGVSFGIVNKGALHAGIYRVLLEQIPRSSSVQTVIVTMNLRSFNADWIYSELETPLQKSIVLLEDRPPLLSRLMLAFRGYDVKTKEERARQIKKQWRKEKFELPFDFPYKNAMDWDAQFSINPILKEDGTWDMEMTALAAHYVKTYAFQIDTLKNPRIRDFDEIVKLAKLNNWQLVFNLMAENTEQAGNLIGEELLFMIRQNRDLLVDRYSSDGVIVVDNLEDVPDEEYIDRNWTTEHYAEKGRRIVAGNVADSLRRLYPADYRNVNPSELIQTRFFHDCEIQEAWGQMQTLSQERAHSGDWSSRTGNGADYSITFQRDLNSIPDTLKSALAISFNAFQESLDPESKLIIELSGENFEYYWHAVPLVNLSQTTGTWVEMSYIMQLPGHVTDAEIIKVYVLNPSSSNIYIDDLGIEFK
jgi:hypothetical protein